MATWAARAGREGRAGRVARAGRAAQTARTARAGSVPIYQSKTRVLALIVDRIQVLER
jgi:hypothetical protein